MKGLSIGIRVVGLPQIEKVFDLMNILPIIDIFDDMPETDKYIDQVIKEEIEKQKK